MESDKQPVIFGRVLVAVRKVHVLQGKNIRATVILHTLQPPINIMSHGLLGYALTILLECILSKTMKYQTWLKKVE